MILDSLENHILRALAEYSLLLGWRTGTGWPACEHKHSLSSRFLDSHQNALKIIESPFTGTKINNKRRNFSFKLQFIFLPVELLRRFVTFDE